jgi:hypothetical protein
MWKDAFSLDHVSLEKNRLSWHLTSENSPRHLGGPKPLAVENNTTLWLGLSISNPIVFRPVFERTTIKALSPASDSRRRLELLRKSREGINFPIVENNGAPIAWTDSFLHFSFFISSSDSRDYIGPEIGAPYESPYLNRPLPNPLINVPIRHHRTALSPTVHLQILVATLLGQLTIPVTLTSPSAPMAMSYPYSAVTP